MVSHGGLSELVSMQVSKKKLKIDEVRVSVRVKISCIGWSPRVVWLRQSDQSARRRRRCHRRHVRLWKSLVLVTG